MKNSNKSNTPDLRYSFSIPDELNPKNDKYNALKTRIILKGDLMRVVPKIIRGDAILSSDEEDATIINAKFADFIIEGIANNTFSKDAKINIENNVTESIQLIMNMCMEKFFSKDFFKNNEIRLMGKYNFKTSKFTKIWRLTADSKWEEV